jgi:hypothetical protein
MHKSGGLASEQVASWKISAGRESPDGTGDTVLDSIDFVCPGPDGVGAIEPAAAVYRLTIRGTVLRLSIERHPGCAVHRAAAGGSEAYASSAEQ